MPDAKLDAYIAKAKMVTAKPLSESDIAALEARLQGCKEQFEEVGLKLKEAVASADENAAKQHEDLLKVNYALRKSIVSQLKAAKVAVSDPDVE
jgi:hypothetical protein